MDSQLTYTYRLKSKGRDYYDVYSFGARVVPWDVPKNLLDVHIAHYSGDGTKLAITNFWVDITEDLTIQWLPYRRVATDSGYNYDTTNIPSDVKEFAERIVKNLAFW